VEQVEDEFECDDQRALDEDREWDHAIEIVKKRYIFTHTQPQCMNFTCARAVYSTVY
jgi:hypothetical protein